MKTKSLAKKSGSVTLATAVLVGGFSLPTAQAAETNNPINVNSRSAVSNAFKTRYLPATKSQINWTGSVTGCKAGTQSADSLSKGNLTINFYRGLAGLDSVTLNADLNKKAQAAALIMQANNTLNHYPSTTAKCSTALGRDGAQTSNLYGIWGADIPHAANSVDSYMEDSGANNTAVGHRRWLLNPETMQMGIGTTDNFNAITVIGGQSSAKRANPDWITFPNAGYFPQQLEPLGRWSISSDKGVDFSAAKVTVKDSAGRTLSVKKQPVDVGYGPNTLVFEVDGIKRASGSGEAAYKVSVTGMKKAGKTISHAYTVRLFDGNNPGEARPPAGKPSIASEADLVAIDASGKLWNYGSRVSKNSPRELIGSSGWGVMKDIHVIDWNKDGVQDIVAQRKDGRLDLYAGKKTGGFSRSTIGSSGWAGFELIVGKFKNTDTYPSIVAKSQRDGRLFVYSNPNGKEHGSRTLLGTGWKNLGINLLDWDKDGNVDIIAKSTAGSGQLKLYRTNGAGKFVSESRKVIGASGWDSMATLDAISGYNGAGTSGLIAKSVDGKLYYYQSNKNAFGKRILVGSSGWKAYKIAG